MAWTNNEPDKTTKTGATGADITKANFMHLHNVFDQLCWTAALADGFDPATATNVEVKGLLWTAIDDTDSPYTMLAKQKLLIDTTSAAVQVDLPVPAVGDTFTIVDAAGTFATNACTINPDIYLIEGSDADYVLKTNNIAVSFVYSGTTRGWVVIAQEFTVNIEEKVDDYVLLITDRDKFIDMNKATGVALTVPKNSSVAFPVGTTIALRQKGAGAVTITPVDGDVTINALDGLVTTGQYAVAGLLKIATNTWQAMGSLEP